MLLQPVAVRTFVPLFLFFSLFPYLASVSKTDSYARSATHVGDDAFFFLVSFRSFLSLGGKSSFQPGGQGGQQIVDDAGS